ncbi:MAG: substrate-binding domain-containing protein, partial [Sedimentibacter sp.]
VAGSKFAIGFDSIGFVDNTVKAVPIGNVSANKTTVQSGTYPLSRALYVVTKGAPSQASAMFIDYLKSAEAQKDIVTAEGYISLR